MQLLMVQLLPGRMLPLLLSVTAPLALLPRCGLVRCAVRTVCGAVLERSQWDPLAACGRLVCRLLGHAHTVLAPACSMAAAGYKDLENTPQDCSAEQRCHQDCRDKVWAVRGNGCRVTFWIVTNPCSTIETCSNHAICKKRVDVHSVCRLAACSECRSSRVHAAPALCGRGLSY